MTNKFKNISIIVPIYNEQDSVKTLYFEIKKVLDEDFSNYEIIFIDDGVISSPLNP